ncbi:MAG: DUF1592 domain-containing protein, partial [Myxococcota bacterium]
MVRRLLAAGLLLGACASDPAVDDASGSDADRSGLTPTQLLNRASLDMRGIRPSAEELSRVEEDPERVDAMIDAFVDDPAFGQRMKDVFAGAWRTRVDFYNLPGEAYADEESTLHAAIGEEPLNLIAYIADNDLPFSVLLTSPDTFVDERLVDLWPLEVQPDDGTVVAPGVVRARYRDGRPLAGVLSMNSVFWRHSSTIENANRG